MSSPSDFDLQEAFEYRPGQRVELQAQPGVFNTIASYDPMMVPPIMLVDDPMPRYPHELRVVPSESWKTWLGISKPLRVHSLASRR